MKKTLSMLIALAAALTAVSCNKIETPAVWEEEQKQEETVRIITAGFDESEDDTKTTLSGSTPLWAVGDKVRLLNATSYQDVTLTDAQITNNGKGFKVSTTLTGQLYAVYPASATTATSCSGNIALTIPATQSNYNFNNAHMCVARADGTYILFKNVTSILKINLATSVKKITVTTGTAVTGTLNVTMGSNGSVSTSLANGGKTITATTSSKTVVYLAVAPCTTTATITYDDGTYYGTTSKSSKALARSKMYNIAYGPAWDKTKKRDANGRVGVQLWSGGPYIADRNIGASAPEQAGIYFSWGSVKQVYTSLSGNNFTFPSTNPDKTRYPRWNKNDGFYWNNTAYFNGSEGNDDTAMIVSSWNKYANTSNLTLEAMDDAATVNWGSSWRTPKADEFKTWMNQNKFTMSAATVNGVACLKLTGTNGNVIYIPKTGYAQRSSRSGYGASVLLLGADGSYCNAARNINLAAPSTCFISTDNRYYAVPVRAVMK